MELEQYERPLPSCFVAQSLRTGGGRRAVRRCRGASHGRNFESWRVNQPLMCPVRAVQNGAANVAVEPHRHASIPSVRLQGGLFRRSLKK